MTETNNVEIQISPNNQKFKDALIEHLRKFITHSTCNNKNWVYNTIRQWVPLSDFTVKPCPDSDEDIVIMHFGDLNIELRFQWLNRPELEAKNQQYWLRNIA